ncbi:Uncharacterized conserved protein YaaN involved in tellurite resistance [Hathewaya proteolytica DSM 3090]|uniref:Uncharacterized conserved protein YaaN involved in tellurite resistance n=1 Tax=Hathewaya proteolytica DSM 3090 TaxID=1121331 RepID=A0A1M6QEB4_9CLOT|nr:toxic anion resistance protein [Hathewaya proteolytica]SHK18599.1 Uncharacterized conserved protein YaaN involved in tellurite resistance [Hathewaya proteolytica DSM 3090]
MENENIQDAIVIPENSENEIVEITNAYEQELKSSPEVVELTTKMDINNSNSILEFGSEPAQKISQYADKILNSIKSSSVESSGDMIKQLTVIMKKFDRNDFVKEEKPGFFDKLFGKASKSVDKIMGKYRTIGGEIDNIYTELVAYKKDINQTNAILDNLYEENIHYYKELEKYIMAGEIIENEVVTKIIPSLEQTANTSGDQMDVVKLQNAKDSLELLRQRIYDLQMARMVSVQTAPQIRMIQKGNYKLISKIHSAFVVTIPVFKNGIVQAVALKRQSNVVQSLNELDRTTNELLIKNAENLRQQSTDIARLSGSSTVKIDTIERTWNTIMQGIEETRNIEEENKNQRQESMKRLKEIQDQMKQKRLV